MNHIDLRVNDLAVAQEFYELLLPALGYTERFHGDAWKVWAAAPDSYFAITESAEHVVNENRIAFAVASHAVVDRIAELVEATPKQMPYGPDYYAIFFADPSGNLLEVYVRND
ncbi:MAG TPA: hypothetical protein VFM96_01925 [Gaiellaceae bacterium]|nr:hypothetical protein [Gaiellaceae bacterium]